jgi:hypothetical protein
MFLETWKEGFCLSGILRFADEKELSSKRRKTCFLMKEVTLLLAPSYEATKDAGSQVNCISSCQHLTFAPRPMAVAVVCTWSNRVNFG